MESDCKKVTKTWNPIANARSKGNRAASFPAEIIGDSSSEYMHDIISKSIQVKESSRVLRYEKKDIQR